MVSGIQIDRANTQAMMMIWRRLFQLGKQVYLIVIHQVCVVVFRRIQIAHVHLVRLIYFVFDYVRFGSHAIAVIVEMCGEIGQFVLDSVQFDAYK